MQPPTDTYTEIQNTRNRFFAFAMSGQLDSMLACHDSSSNYRLYENGKAFTYINQAEGHTNLKTYGVVSIKFEIKVLDSIILNKTYFLESWRGVTITSFDTGKKDTSENFVVTLLYKKINARWKFTHLHSSSEIKSEPDQNNL